MMNNYYLDNGLPRILSDSDIFKLYKDGHSIKQLSRQEFIAELKRLELNPIITNNLTKRK